MRSRNIEHQRVVQPGMLHSDQPTWGEPTDAALIVTRLAGEGRSADASLASWGMTCFETLGRDAEQSPLIRHAFEGMAAAIIKHQARAHHEVLDRARHEDFARTSEGRDPGPDMHGEPGDVIGQDLDLAGMQAGSDIEVKLPYLVPDRQGTADGAGGTVKAREEPVTDDPHLVPAKSIELPADDPVVIREQTLPSVVAQRGRELR
jgi:hypothetical protein